MRRAPDVDIATVRAMPELIEGTREDHRQRAEPDEREAELRVERSNTQLAAARGAAARRGRGGEARGTAPEDPPAVEEEMRNAPERVPSHHAMPRDVPRRAEPAEEDARDANDERRHRPQAGEPGAPQRQRDRRHAESILGTGLQQLDLCALVADGQRGDHDAPARMSLSAHREPARTETREAAELALVDRLRGRHERSRAARLHLDEHEAVAVAADQIDLAEAGALVTGDDAQSTTHELGLRGALAGEAQGAAVHAREIGALLRGRDLDDPVGAAVRREVERSVRALRRRAEATLGPGEEDARGLERPVGLLLEPQQHGARKRREEEIPVPGAPLRSAHERVPARRDIRVVERLPHRFREAGAGAVRP